MANYTGRTQPTPVPGEKPHPSLQAPAGTMLHTPESCDDGGGGCVVAYPVQAHPNLDTRFTGHALAAPDQVKLSYVPAAQAARDLAWWPTAPAPRIATQEEADAYFGTIQHGDPQAAEARP